MNAERETGKRHTYATRITWSGDPREGTSTYAAYTRRYVVRTPGKPDLAGSADPMFRGDADRHNPEDLFLASISACHMLVFLALCARQGVRVTAYKDDARGNLEVHPGGGGALHGGHPSAIGDRRPRGRRGTGRTAPRDGSRAVLHREVLQRADPHRPGDPARLSGRWQTLPSGSNDP